MQGKNEHLPSTNADDNCLIRKYLESRKKHKNKYSKDKRNKTQAVQLLHNTMDTKIGKNIEQETKIERSKMLLLSKKPLNLVSILHESGNVPKKKKEKS